jgi:hypothetical protein
LSQSFNADRNDSCGHCTDRYAWNLGVGH